LILVDSLARMPDTQQSPHSTPPQLTPLQELGRAVKAAQWRHHRALDRELATLGSTLAQWDALRAIARHPRWSSHALAGETFQSDQAFGALTRRMVQLGLVDRRPGTGRRVEHHLTASGRQILEQGTVLAEEILTRSFASLDGAERELLLELLGRVGSAEDPGHQAAAPAGAAASKHDGTPARTERVE
jgi:DNA-binding MarR family transcriptional regulator